MLVEAARWRRQGGPSNSALTENATTSFERYVQKNGL